MFNRDKAQIPAGPRCSGCGSPLGDEKVCSCGTASPTMSFDERREYELEQYKAYKARVVASV
jgi:hypothetical protein